jgi:hypothetical protein
MYALILSGSSLFSVGGGVTLYSVESVSYRIPNILETCSIKVVKTGVDL